MRYYGKYLIAAMLLLVPLTCPAAEKLRQKMSVYLDEKGGSLKNPEGVACDDKGTIIVADTGNGRLLRYREEEGALKGGADIKAAQLLYPTRVQMNSKGEIFALDGKQRRIARFNKEGGFIGFVEPQGVPAPASFVPRSFKVDGSDLLYLLDIQNERVLVLDAAGKFQRQVPFPKPYGFFSDVAVSITGDLFLLDSVGAAVYVARKESPDFTPLGKAFHDKAEFPTYIAIDSKGSLYVVDQDGGGIVTLAPDGSFTGRLAALGWKEGQLYYPSQICIGPTGTLVIADRNNSRIQIYETVK